MVKVCALSPPPKKTLNLFHQTIRVSVYPPVEWKGILNAVNRPPMDVAECQSTVTQWHGLGWRYGVGWIKYYIELYRESPTCQGLGMKSRLSPSLLVVGSDSCFRLIDRSWTRPYTYTLRSISCSIRAIPSTASRWPAASWWCQQKYSRDNLNHQMAS